MVYSPSDQSWKGVNWIWFISKLLNNLCHVNLFLKWTELVIELYLYFLLFTLNCVLVNTLHWLNIKTICSFSWNGVLLFVCSYFTHNLNRIPSPLKMWILCRLSADLITCLTRQVNPQRLQQHVKYESSKPNQPNKQHTLKRAVPLTCWCEH